MSISVFISTYWPVALVFTGLMIRNMFFARYMQQEPVASNALSSESHEILALLSLLHVMTITVCFAVTLLP